MPHHEGHGAQVIGLEFPGGKAKNGRISASGMEQAREHLERGRFSRTVRTEESDNLSLLDLEVDLLYGFHIVILAFEKTFHRSAEPAFAFGDLVCFT